MSIVQFPKGPVARVFLLEIYRIEEHRQHAETSQKSVRCGPSLFKYGNVYLRVDCVRFVHVKCIFRLFLT